MKEPLKQYKLVEKLELPKIEEESPKVFKRISCPACAEALNSEQIDLPNKVAKCGSCHVIFSIVEEVESIKVSKEIRQEIFRPEGIDLFYFKGDMEITLTQNVHGFEGFLTGIFGFLAPFCTFFQKIMRFPFIFRFSLWSVCCFSLSII